MRQPRQTAIEDHQQHRGEPPSRRAHRGLQILQQAGRRVRGLPREDDDLRDHGQRLAQAIDPQVTARSFLPVAMAEDQSVFRYLDTASSRARISLITGKLALPKVAIVGLGGTGSYVLDLIAKTPVSEIHLFDGDTFHAHNAFRAPGAASVEDLDATPNKVDYRRGPVRHHAPRDRRPPLHVDESNIERAAGHDVRLPHHGRRAAARRSSSRSWRNIGVPFIDIGMGVSGRRRARRHPDRDHQHPRPTASSPRPAAASPSPTAATSTTTTSRSPT